MGWGGIRWGEVGRGRWGEVPLVKGWRVELKILYGHHLLVLQTIFYISPEGTFWRAVQNTFLPLGLITVSLFDFSIDIFFVVRFWGKAQGLSVRRCWWYKLFMPTLYFQTNRNRSVIPPNCGLARTFVPQLHLQNVHKCFKFLHPWDQWCKLIASSPTHFRDVVSLKELGQSYHQMVANGLPQTVSVWPLQPAACSSLVPFHFTNWIFCLSLPLLTLLTIWMLGVGPWKKLVPSKHCICWGVRASVTCMYSHSLTKG